MAIHYDFYEQTGHFADGEERLMVRTVTPDTMGTEELVRHIEEACTLTGSDVKAALAALAGQLTAALREGRSFYLEGFGYFSPRVGGEIRRNADGRLWLKDAAVRTVTFRPEKRLLKRLSGVEITSREHRGRHSLSLSAEQLREVALRLTTEQGFFTPAQFAAASGMARSSCYGLLRRAEAEGLIENIGSPRSKIYRAAEPSA